MKQVMCFTFALVTLIGLSGCQSFRAACGLESCNGCADGTCDSGNCAEGGCADGSGAQRPGLMPGGRGPHQGYGPQNFGPPTGAVAYPYYTTRGPRDFLEPNPPSIGPWLTLLYNRVNQSKNNTPNRIAVFKLLSCFFALVENIGNSLVAVKYEELKFHRKEEELLSTDGRR